jgi:hypothetical protein
MNKQLRQFERESGLSIFGLGAKTHMWEAALEKYAELIVQEAADIAKQHVMNISTYADADFVDEQIKKHFGVEL